MIAYATNKIMDRLTCGLCQFQKIIYSPHATIYTTYIKYIFIVSKIALLLLFDLIL